MIDPLGDRIVVKVEGEEEHTLPSGIVLPQQSREKPQRGEVLAVGPGLNHPMPGGEVVVIPVGVEAGDKILFSKYAGTEVTVDEEEVLILREGDVLGKET